jgi:hypothetical protein
MDKAVRKYLAGIGAKGGKIGGKARTHAKRQAARRNVAKARRSLRTDKLCKRCKRERLGVRNKSGVCRKCQRGGKKL